MKTNPDGTCQRFRAEPHLSFDIPAKEYWRVVECVGHLEDGSCLTMQWDASYATPEGALAAIEYVKAKARGA